jgi:hypothetical protein
MRFLKQSTAVLLQIGPFVDATDGFTAETALTPSSSDVELWKHNAVTAVNIFNRTWVHLGNGIYTVTLLTTDVDTAGPLSIHGHISGARPVWHEFMVLPATSYDAIVGGSPLPADMLRVNGNASAAGNLVFGALAIKPVTIGSGSSTTRIATNLTESAGDHWNGRTLAFVSGALAGQASTITDYNGSTKELVVNALTTAPVSGDIAVIL